MPEKIAFLKLGSFSQVNQRIQELLIKYFPEYEVETIDVVELIKGRRDIIFFNIFFMLKEFGLELLSGKRTIKRSFFTSYMKRKMTSLITNRVLKSKYKFLFQTQDLFDSSTINLPYFVYTDGTYLGAIYNPSFDKRKLNSKSFKFRVNFEKKIFQNAKINFAMSKFVAKSIIEQYSCHQENVVCAYAGSPAPIRDTIKKKEGYENKNILFIGIDWERKGGPELLRAFKLVLQKHPDAKLTIVGCSPQTNLPNCREVGLVPLEEIPSHYENASVFCLPSKWEGIAIVFIEALMNKLPLVAYDIMPVRGYIVDGENGYLVPLNNIEKLAEALSDLISDPEKCRKFGEKGYSMARERYTWDKVGECIRLNIDKVTK